MLDQRIVVVDYFAREYLRERLEAMKENRIVVVNDMHHFASYYRPFEEFAPLGEPDLVFTNPDQVLCLVFTGGEDVDPSMYGIKPNRKTGSNLKRDLEEKMYFEEAARRGIPMAGICRGAQFLCVMNGGILAQHISNHGYSHRIQTSHGPVVEVTSTHHQMAIPPREAKVLAWAEPKRSKEYEGADGELLYPEVEYEGVYYPQTHSLGMQWHPEAMSKSTAGFKYTTALIHRLIARREM